MKGNYGHPFKAGHGVTQGGPLSVKLFIIIVDAVVCEWMRIMRETLNNSDGQLAVQIEALFAIFMLTMDTLHQRMPSSFRRPSTS